MKALWLLTALATLALVAYPPTRWLGAPLFVLAVSMYSRATIRDADARAAAQDQAEHRASALLLKALSHEERLELQTAGRLRVPSRIFPGRYYYGANPEAAAQPENEP